MNYKILLADSSPATLEFFNYHLLKEGFKVILATSQTEVLSAFIEKPDMLIINMNTRDNYFFKFFRKIKSKKGFEKIPIILLIQSSNEINKINGLEAEANDVILIPISSKNFIARIKANIRKVNIEHLELLPKKINIGNLEVDRERFIAVVNNKEIPLRKKEFELLFFLARKPGYVFSRDIIIYNVWGNEMRIVDRTVDVHIRKLRAKLDKAGYYIKTIRGVGYTLKAG